jgi:hypothetical protein
VRVGIEGTFNFSSAMKQSSKPTKPQAKPPSSRGGQATSRKPVPAEVQRASESQRAAEPQQAPEPEVSTAVKAEASTQQPSEREQELKLELQASTEREQALAALVDSSGSSSISLGPFDWSTDKARSLIAEESEKMARVEAMLSQFRESSSCIKDMIAQQEALQMSLQAVAA